MPAVLAVPAYSRMEPKIGPTQGIINLQASGKPFRYVLIGHAMLEKTRNERGVPYRILQIPTGTLPLQTQAMSAYANPDYVAVHKDFPEETAYEYVRLVIRHLDEVNKTGGIASRPALSNTRQSEFVLASLISPAHACCQAPWRGRGAWVCWGP